MTSFLNFKARQVAPEKDELAEAVERVAMIKERARCIAELIYNARMAYLGAMGLPWDLLTTGQRDSYQVEAEHLITGGW